MISISIDLETKSTYDLKKVGVYKYAEKAEIIWLSFLYEEDGFEYDLVTVDCTKQKPPAYFLADLVNPKIKKKAWNAQFEIELIISCWGINLCIDQWECTMVRTGMCGLPMDLDTAAKVLNIKNQKDKSGSALITLFSKPCKPTKTNGGRIWNLPEHFPDRWRQYGVYNGIDVLAESEISRKLQHYHIPLREHKYWVMDQVINRRGVYIDLPFVKKSISLDAEFRKSLLAEAQRIAGIQNANSGKQLLEWLNHEMNTDDFEEWELVGDDGPETFKEITSLKKADLPVLLEKATTETVKRILNIRIELAKTSVKKFHTMLGAVCEDGRIRGMLQYYGANRTGRAAGRLVQLHNFPKPEKQFADVPQIKTLVNKGDGEMLEIIHGPIPRVLASMLRSVFIPKTSRKLKISDFSAIEARVIAWVSGEEWRLNVFRGDGKIYEASAAMMLKKGIDEVTEADRDKGKIGELALGFGGGKHALLNMGSEKMGLKDEELEPLKEAWRAASPKIVAFWKIAENAAKNTLQTGENTSIGHGMYYSYKQDYLFLTLPSGRKLSYYKARLIPGDKWGTQIVYEGVNQKTKKWGKVKTYGGKLVENLVQAIARDLLYHGLYALHTNGYKIILHVHDEVACDDTNGSIEEMDALFSSLPPWAEGLPLGAKGFESEYYKK